MAPLMMARMARKEASEEEAEQMARGGEERGGGGDAGGGSKAETFANFLTGVQQRKGRMEGRRAVTVAGGTKVVRANEIDGSED